MVSRPSRTPRRDPVDRRPARAARPLAIAYPIDLRPPSRRFFAAFLSLSLLMLWLLVSVGCSAVNTVERAEPRAAPIVIDDARITYDQTLKKRARIIRLNETTVGNGLLKIQAELQNTTDLRQLVNYRFDWVDQDGIRIDTPLSSWSALSLAAKERRLITATAPTPDAADFRLSLLEKRGTW